MEQPIIECEQCGTDNIPMGEMGGMLHYRCRSCGWTYSKDKEELENEIIGDAEARYEARYYGS